MFRKTLGVIVIVIGMISMIVSIMADTIGIGTGNGIGPRQIAGTIFGFVLLLIGTWMIFRNKK